MFKKAYDFLIAVAALMFAGALFANNARAQNVFDYMYNDQTSYYVSAKAGKYCPALRPARESEVGGPSTIVETLMNQMENKTLVSLSSEDAILGLLTESKEIHDLVYPIITVGKRYVYAIVKSTSDIWTLDDIRDNTRVIFNNDTASRSWLTLNSLHRTKPGVFKTTAGLSAAILSHLDSGEADMVYISGMEPDVELNGAKSNGFDYRFIRLESTNANKEGVNRLYSRYGYKSDLFAGRNSNVLATNNVLYTNKYAFVNNSPKFVSIHRCLTNFEQDIKSEATKHSKNLWAGFDTGTPPKYYGMEFVEWMSKTDTTDNAKPNLRKKAAKVPAL